MASSHWSHVTALFGGAFDPPHVGHREAVRTLFTDLHVARVRILPSPTPPHKPAIASAEHRVEMTRLNFERRAAFPFETDLDLRELDRARVRPDRPSYSFDTLQEMRAEFPNLAFVIGADQLAALHTWYRFPEILGLCSWIVLERRPDGHDQAMKTLREWKASGLASQSNEREWKLQAGRGQTGSLASAATYLILNPTEAPALSSTQIRETIAKTGRPPEGALDPQVELYLKRHNLYGMGS